MNESAVSLKLRGALAEYEQLSRFENSLRPIKVLAKSVSEKTLIEGLSKLKMASTAGELMTKTFTFADLSAEREALKAASIALRDVEKESDIKPAFDAVVATSDALLIKEKTRLAQEMVQLLEKSDANFSVDKTKTVTEILEHDAWNKVRELIKPLRQEGHDISMTPSMRR